MSIIHNTISANTQCLFGKGPAVNAASAHFNGNAGKAISGLGGGPMAIAKQGQVNSATAQVQPQVSQQRFTAQPSMSMGSSAPELPNTFQGASKGASSTSANNFMQLSNLRSAGMKSNYFAPNRVTNARSHGIQMNAGGKLNPFVTSKNIPKQTSYQPSQKAFDPLSLADGLRGPQIQSHDANMDFMTDYMDSQFETAKPVFAQPQRSSFLMSSINNIRNMVFASCFLFPTAAYAIAPPSMMASTTLLADESLFGANAFTALCVLAPITQIVSIEVAESMMEDGHGHGEGHK